MTQSSCFWSVTFIALLRFVFCLVIICIFFSSGASILGVFAVQEPRCAWSSDLALFADYQQLHQRKCREQQEGRCGFLSWRNWCAWYFPWKSFYWLFNFLFIYFDSLCKTSRKYQEKIREYPDQRCIQNPVKHLRWSFLWI